jgi:hypothetical protein
VEGRGRERLNRKEEAKKRKNEEMKGTRNKH